MRRSSVQKPSTENREMDKTEGERQKKVSNASSVKLRKISVDQSSTEKTATKKEIQRKESLQSVYIVPKHPPPISSPEKEYEPYDHRNVKHPTTFFETLMHLIKGSLGTGVLAMPYAFSNSGYAMGTFCTLTMGFICTYVIHMLISASYELCKRNKKPQMTYPETAEAAFAQGPKQIRKFSKIAPKICNIFLLVYEIGSSAIYVVFISSNIKDVVDYYQAPEDRIDLRWYCVFILLPLILMNCVRSYKYLAPLATVATVLTAGSFATIFYYLFAGLPDFKNRAPVGPPQKFPMYFTTVVFAMEAIGMVFPLENEMKSPRKFSTPFGVLNISMFLITILYVGVGLFGYLKFGDNVLGSITLSLPQDDRLCQAVRIMLSISIFCTHPLLLHPAIDIVWLTYIKRFFKDRPLLWEYVTRISIVLITFLLGIVVPYLELFIALMGALCMSMLGLMFPAIIELCTYWYDINGVQFAFFFVKNFTLCVMASYGLIFGVKTSFEGLAEKMFE